MAKKFGLGNGLASLLGDAANTSGAAVKSEKTASAKEEPEKSEESRKTAQGKSKEKLNPVFTFEYDANINKLVVKKNGAFVTDIPIATVAGQNGKNAYKK